MERYDEWMDHACQAARRGIALGQSPFGAAIAQADGSIVCAAHNTVRADGDPTRHAEMNAIRSACRTLGTIDLCGYLIVTTCEPCPMCASAIHWARLDAVVYGATISDARDAGFNELAVSCPTLYETGGSDVRVVSGVRREACRSLFAEWLGGPAAHPY